MSDKYTYLFPYEKVPKGSNIVIYGAGDVGQEYLKQMQMTGYAKVVAMADRAWDKYPKMIVPLLAPEEINNLDYDYIVLALKMKTHVPEISAKLWEMGVDKEKIIYQGARGAVDSVLIAEPSSLGKNNNKYAFEESSISIALKYGPGLGDAVIKKKLFQAIEKIAPNAKIDIYAPSASKYIPAIYRDEPCFHAAIDDGGALYVDNHEKYGLSMSIFYMIQMDHVKYETLSKTCPRLADAAKKIEAANAEYKLTIYPSTQNWIHFGRSLYKGWNCYTLYNYTGAFDIKDQHVDIPFDPGAERDFNLLNLKQYITVNYGNGASSKDNQKLISKQWPKEYFESFIRKIKGLFPNIKVIQIGDENALNLVGADEYILGKNLEIVKYILKNSVLHLDIEGGLMHLATQIGTKCIVLYGPTRAEMFSYPQNINIVSEKCKGCYQLYENIYQCARGLDRPECMYSITPEMVMKKAEEYLEKIKG